MQRDGLNPLLRYGREHHAMVGPTGLSDALGRHPGRGDTRAIQEWPADVRRLVSAVQVTGTPVARVPATTRERCTLEENREPATWGSPPRSSSLWASGFPWLIAPTDEFVGVWIPPINCQKPLAHPLVEFVGVWVPPINRQKSLAHPLVEEHKCVL
jgi:hypothetical protein